MTSTSMPSVIIGEGLEGQQTLPLSPPKRQRRPTPPLPVPPQPLLPPLPIPPLQMSIPTVRTITIEEKRN